MKLLIVHILIICLFSGCINQSEDLITREKTPNGCSIPEYKYSDSLEKATNISNVIMSEDCVITLEKFYFPTDNITCYLGMHGINSCVIGKR